MYREFCKSKIAHVTITEAQLFYEGSITIDEDLIKAVDILPGEKVEVLNMNNGQRFNTYVIAGKAGSGRVCLNGPAARLGIVGDQLIILSYAMFDSKELENHAIKIIYVDEKNRIKDQTSIKL